MAVDAWSACGSLACWGLLPRVPWAGGQAITLRKQHI